MREKLIELLESVPQPDSVIIGLRNGKQLLSTSRIADHLIANGVTVQECGHWVSYQSDEPYGCYDEKEWYKCSKCGKDADGRCYDDEWYSAPILSSCCPRCGAKMMPQPPKAGEV